METHPSWKRNVMRHTGMTWWPRLPVLSSVTGRIIVGFGLLIIILVAVVVASAWLVREQGSDLAFWLLVISGAGGAVTGLAASALIARSILRPLSSLESTALAMACGDLAARAPTTGPRELARLGSALNQMTDSLLGASERRDLDGALQRSEEYSRSLIEHAPDIITILDGDGTIRYASPSVQRVLGYEPEELIDRDAFAFVHPDDMPAAIVNFSLLLLDPGTPRSAMFRLRHADGSWRTLEAMGNNVIDDSRLAIVFSYRDISERRCAEEPEGLLAHHARLADPPNRALLDDRFTRTFAQALRTEQALAVMSIHLDRFNVINDEVHYTSEHHLLRAAGQRLTGLMREGDAVARVGDGEFIVLLPGTAEATDAAKIAESILQALRPPFHFDGQEVHATTNIGISLYPYDGEDAATLLKNADAAMRRAKEKGRNNYQLYAPVMAARASHQSALEDSLHRALEHEEFLVYYQPQANLDTGQIVGMEALVRWQHPDWGLVLPSEFIPLAEETGLIQHLGEWVLRAVCAQSKAWQEAGLPPLRLAVNLSARQFQQPDLVEVVARVLNETGLEPHSLELEITEGAAMQNVHLTTKVLRDFREMGIQIAIDDFGTGYSSLSYLKDFPIHALKIDQSFVRDVMTSLSDAAIVSAIIAMAHNLDLKVIAEGVETRHQLAFLRQRGCDEYQGYLLGRPMSALAFEATVKQHKRSRGRSGVKVTS